MIATPIVLNVVQDAREKAKIESANGVVDAAYFYISETMLDSSKSTSQNIYDSIKNNIKGEKPDSGEVYVNENNQVAVALKYGDECYIKNYTETTPKKVETSDCSLEPFDPSEATVSSCFAYTENDGTLTITDYKCYDENTEGLPTITDVIIPKKINGKNATIIGDDSFATWNPDNNPKYHLLTSVVIPNGIKVIGAHAFDNNQLTTVTIPDSVTTIQYEAFEYNQLTSVTIGNGVTEIEMQAFQNNLDLATVTLGNHLEIIEEEAFYSDAIREIIIPDSVITIGDNVFNSNQLESVTIGSGVKTIGNNAFAYNSNLTAITIDNTEDSIAGSPWGADSATITYLR